MAISERVTGIGAADLIGDIYAPEGSREWCVAIRRELQKLLDQHETDHEQLQICVGSLNQYEGWRNLEDAKGKTFASYADFCKAKRPHGLGRDPAEVDALLKEGAAKKTARALAADPDVKPLAERSGRPTQDNVDVVNIRPDGNSTDYLVRRLKRDHPEIASALASGEYPSARAAGIAAGIVKVATTLDVLKKAWAKASKKEKDAFMDWAGEAGW